MKWLEENCDGILLGGKFYRRNELTEGFPSVFPSSLAAFLTEWWNDSPYVYVQTSGSTGTPKSMRADKVCMMQSAQITCHFLELKEKDRALLCMPLEYIAGKMMVVRALTHRLDLTVVPPSSHPLQKMNEIPFQFVAMVPLQLFHSLQTESEKKRLSAIRHLLIGGGSIDQALEQAVRDFPHAVWSTYGMTETLSHIALRRINGALSSPYYTPFEGVDLSLSDEDTLVIHAPEVCPEIVVTNDIAKLLPDGRFRILGRKDNVACSGGIKIRIEEVEAFLNPLLECPFALSWIPDARLGQALVLLVEQPESEPDLSGIRIHLKKLPSYWQPRYLFSTSCIPRTDTGKPARKEIQRYCTLQAKPGK